jgi:hypothetical protein
LFQDLGKINQVTRRSLPVCSATNSKTRFSLKPSPTFTVPAYTGSPDFLNTGTLSPDNIDSSTEPLSSKKVPSAVEMSYMYDRTLPGTLSPGSTSSISPDSIDSIGTSTRFVSLAETLISLCATVGCIASKPIEYQAKHIHNQYSELEHLRSF